MDIFTTYTMQYLYVMIKIFPNQWESRFLGLNAQKYGLYEKMLQIKVVMILNFEKFEDIRSPSIL